MYTDAQSGGDPTLGVTYLFKESKLLGFEVRGSDNDRAHFKGQLETHVEGLTI